jgi:hypothetical protein
MSADLLRRAASEIREHYSAESMGMPTSDPFMYAVADWLTVAGADIWAHGPLCECGTGCDACDDNLWEPHARAALTVARAYLGEDA